MENGLEAGMRRVDNPHDKQIVQLRKHACMSGVRGVGLDGPTAPLKTRQGCLHSMQLGANVSSSTKKDVMGEK